MRAAQFCRLEILYIFLNVQLDLQRTPNICDVLNLKPEELIIR